MLLQGLSLVYIAYMIIGIGTDIVDIARIEQAGIEKLAKKILSAAEIAAISKLTAAKVAKRFAGKEAIAKAFGTGIGAKLAFHDIEIFNDEAGKPLAKILTEPNLQIHLSMSDEKNYAVAFAVISL
jgi:holo-[acyl-carrier protein] synthase